MRRPLLLLATVALLGAFAVAVPAPVPAAAAAAPGVNPSTVDLTLEPGQSATVTKQVTTSPVPPNPDVVFLADTTGSMGTAIEDVKRNAGDIVGSLHDEQPSAQFGVASYQDEELSTYLFRREQDITPDTAQVQRGINQWVLGDGGDLPESAINALFQLATGQMTYRSNDTKIVAWFGDAPSHDPSAGHTLDQTIAALRAAGIRVVAVSLSNGTPSRPGLDAGFDDDAAHIHIRAGQASRIADETGGVVLHAADNQVAQAIRDGIHAIRSTVTPTVSSCDPRLSVTNAPVSVTVESGSMATFTETITLANGSPPGAYHCVVDYLVNGVSDGFVESTTVTVRNKPPMVSAGGPYAGNEDVPVPIAGTVVDPDGPGLNVTWTISPTGTVPPGSSCVFADARALSTTVTCTERGEYILTLTVSDGVNPPVVDTAVLTLINVAPRVDAGGPYSGNEDNPVPILGSVVDPDGPNRVVSWAITTNENVPTGSICSFADATALSTTVTCTEHGDYILTLTVGDGVNPAVSDTATLTVINVAPTVSAGGPYNGFEDNQIPIVGTATDPDGPALTTAWTIVPRPGVSPATVCTFGDPAALSTTVSCTEHGDYDLTLTASDGLNPPVRATTTLTLANVVPTVSAGGPYSGNEDNQIPIAGSITDPDGPAPTVAWSIVPGADVPVGATCAFVDAAALSTSVSCTDHGSYVLTLTVSDTVNPPVSSTTTLTLINVAPTVSAGGPYQGEEDHALPITGTITDPDSPGLTLRWSVVPDAGIDPGVICSFVDPTTPATVLTCSEPGGYTLTLTVDDKVNPPVAATARVSLSQTPGALSLITTVDPAPGYVGGDPVVVTHTVHNAGPAALQGVRLTTTLPAGIVPASVSQAGCATGCDLGTLVPGQTVQIRIGIAPTSAMDAPVSGLASTPGPDIDPTDNGGSVRVVIRAPALLVNPLAGPQGFVTHATGSGFPPGARIRLQWSIGISETPGETTVHPDGTIDAQALVFPKDIRGVRNLQAASVTGPKFGTVTSSPFLVFARTLKPLSFVIR